jgi:5-methylcytosine-specific restriction endonuclease McrA
MTTRKAIPAKVQVAVAIRQANGAVLCPLCSNVLCVWEPHILEHMVPLALGGGNDIDNLRWVHAHCAAKKTNGTKATSAGGDLHKIAKAKRLRLARLAKAEVEKKITKSKWRLKRKMSGEVVRVRTR